ncbi:hypothetical protein Gpo141_00006951 [Globisporangium polare]
MKYPLPKNLFPAVTLTEGQEEQYERLAHSLVKETVADYDHFWSQDRRVVDVARWKPIKKRDNIVVYKHRALHGGAAHTSAIARGSSRGAVTWNNSRGGINNGDSSKALGDLEAEDVDPLAQTIGLTSSAFSITERSLQPASTNLPTLLAVGSIKGTLDDVMYGIASPNAASMRVKTSYVDDEIVDGAVLYQMKGPSPAEPFRFLGIKWLVKENQGAVKKFVRPRDFIILEYSSVMMRPSGDRIGFHLMHSVEIPTCRELADKNILRAKVSSCYLYRELPNGFVDLYMTAKVEPRGKVLESMAIRSAASALSTCWKSVACAHNKKLAWLLQNDQKPSFTSSNNFQGSGRGTNTNSSGFATRDGFRDTTIGISLAKKGCGVCRRSFGTFSKSSTCQLCYEQMCYRCRVYKKLSSETLDTMITKTAMVFCKKCIASVSDESSAEIAKQEIWNGRYRSRTRASSSATYATRSSYANPSLYEGMYDGRLSERSNCSSILGEKDNDDNVSVGRASALSNASRMSSRHRYTSSPQNSRRSSVKKISWSVNGDGEGGLESSRGTTATDALTLMDLDPTENESEARRSSSRSSRSPARDNEPILLLNEPVTNVTLREMDYIAPPAEGEHDDDDLESVTNSSVYQESEDDRMSYSSSIALMDEDTDEDVDNPQVFYHPDLSAFPVEEGNEDDVSTDDGGETVNERALVVRGSSSGNQVVDQERITEVHAVVQAQSALYDRDSNPSVQGSEDAHSTGQYPRKQSYQMQLWMQMNDLHDTAEKTYQVAKRNTETLLSQGNLDSESSRKLRSFSQPFQFNVVGLRPGRSMTVAASQAKK